VSIWNCFVTIMDFSGIICIGGFWIGL